MSYNHLAGRLIEIQRSMLGQPAITIAQSIEGLSVSDDGNVKRIESDGCEIIGTLFDRYTQMLGEPAENRLQTAAAEFEELDLPPELGGSAADTSSTEQSRRDEAVDDGATSIEIQSPSADRETRPDTTPADVVTETDADSKQGTDGEEPEIGTLRWEYTIQGGTYANGEGTSDLRECYLLREEDGWQVPISVEEAIVDAVATTAGRRDEDIGRIDEYTEPAEILSVLGSETETVTSFEIGDAVVVVHPSGTIAVRQ